jgi:hypothetical protein
MSIVERLREESEHDPDSHESILFREAADEIERLREKHKACVDITLRQGSEIERLREDNSVWLKAWNAKEKAEWFGDTVKGREVKAELRRMAEEILK